MLTGRKVCDCPNCFNMATGKLKMQRPDSIFGITKVTMHLCSKHYGDMLDFLEAYIGIAKRR